MKRLVELEEHEIRSLIYSHQRMADEAEADAAKTVGAGRGRVLQRVADEYRNRARELGQILKNANQPIETNTEPTL